MQLVIDIDKDRYDDIKRIASVQLNYRIPTVEQIVANGTPLPDGHGKLGDLDKIKKEMQNYHDDCAKTSEYTRLGFETAIAVVEDAPTIIEADKEDD